MVGWLVCEIVHQTGCFNQILPMAAAANWGHHHLSNLIQPEEHFNSLFTIGFLFFINYSTWRTYIHYLQFDLFGYYHSTLETIISVNTYAFGEIHACMLFMFYCMLVSHLASFTIVKRCGPKYWYYKFGSIILSLNTF